MRSMKYNTSALMKSVNRWRAIGVLMVAAAAVLVIIAMVPSRSSSTAPPLGTLIKFTTMYGVDGPFVNSTTIRGVRGDELPWDVGNVDGTLTTDGHLQLNVTGVVFANDPEVPANIRGTNDEAQFRALVSCLTEGHKGNGHGNGEVKIATANVTTAGSPATTTGNSTIDAFVSLPNPCVAPIIFVMSGSEDKWFTVTGAGS